MPKKKSYKNKSTTDRSLSAELKDALSSLDDKIPAYANTLPRMLGGISLVAIVILIVSGIIMYTFFVPTVQQAYKSIYNFIVNVPFGDYIRSIHFWGASILIFVLVLHLARVIISGSYKYPRRMQYIIGVLMFFLILLIANIGESIYMDQQSVDDMLRIIWMAQNTGLSSLAGFFGLQINISTLLSILTGWHIGILILPLLLLIAAHVWLVHRNGFAPKPDSKNTISRKTAGKGSSSLGMHYKKVLGAGLILFALISTLAIISPAPLWSAGVSDPNVMITKPAIWAFYPADIMQSTTGNWSMVFGPLVLFALLMALPFIDKSPYLSWKRRKKYIAFALIPLLIGVYFGVQDLAPTPINGAVVCPNASLCRPLVWVSNGSNATPAAVIGNPISVPNPMLSMQELPILLGIIFISAALGLLLWFRK